MEQSFLPDGRGCIDSPALSMYNKKDECLESIESFTLSGG